MPKFFVDEKNIFDNEIIINGDDAIHIKKVLRMKVHDELLVSDALSNDYYCTIKNLDDFVSLKILKIVKNNSEASCKVYLYVALLKGEKFELVIQKAVELGVYKIIPFISARCVSRPDKKALSSKLLRWQKIADEAAKQCGRGILPEISPLLSFDDMLSDALKRQYCLFFYENEQNTSLKTALDGKTLENCSVIIGPEGGFDEKEVEKASNNGAITVSLGRRILRAETAPICALSLILYHTNDFDL